ncbi:MAG: RluA family pseudouridine synthase [Lachnospiraceae bacterium]|nr:RluA family pseudouridine synthase [Lachnospiraceae bacterium]
MDDSMEQDILNFIIDHEYAGYIGVRIDKCLSEIMDDYSRAYIQKLIDDGNITCDGKVLKSNYKLRKGDVINVIIPEPIELEILPENIPLDIIYEDNDILIVNKPKGMVVHPAPGHSSGTLVNAIMYHCKDSLSTINGVLRPGIVHRIDMDTTGLLMVCKNDVAHRVMSDKFKVHDITRAYTAICYNHFSVTEGTVDKPIARHKVDRKKMAIDPNGRRAVTHYKVLEELSNNFSLIECRLETGRTHQIRVHMASINHPLLGDEVYGPKNKPFKTEGQVLHAGVLGFEHPITGEYMEFKAEVPEYFGKILERLRK